jgi:hypothetical protein
MTDSAAQIEFLKQHSSYAQRWLNSRPEWEDWLQSQAWDWSQSSHSGRELSQR